MSIETIFTEFAGSPKFGFGRDGATAQRRGIVQWSNVNLLYYLLFPSAIAGTIQYPLNFPGSGILFADHVTVDPFPSEPIILSSQPNYYDFAEVTIDYKTIQYETSPNATQILTRRISTSGEFMTLPNKGLAWATGSVKVKNNELSAGKMIGLKQLSVTLHRVPHPFPESTLDGLIGKVNNATFDGKPSETVMFLGYEANQTIQYPGDLTWELQLNLLQRQVDGDSSVGWNHAFNSDLATPAWAGIRVEGGEKIYKTANFSVLY